MYVCMYVCITAWAAIWEALYTDLVLSRQYVIIVISYGNKRVVYHLMQFKTVSNIMIECTKQTCQQFNPPN